MKTKAEICNGASSGNWEGRVFQEFNPAYTVFEFYDGSTCTREMIVYQ